MHRFSNDFYRYLRSFFAIAALLATASCGGSGSGGTTTATQNPEPNVDSPANPTPDPIDLPQVDFSPSIPVSGNPTSLLSNYPVVSLTLNYPEAGIPAGYRIVVSAYVEDAASSDAGVVVWQRTIVTTGESSKQTTINVDPYLLPATPDGSVALLVDAVVFNSDVANGPQLEYAAVPRSRAEFSAQEQDGLTVYERIEFERALEPVMLASTPTSADYVNALSPENDDSEITIEHGSFFNNTLYLLVNYTDACENDAFEVQLQVSESDLAAKRFPNSVRRTSPERCSGTATLLLTVSLDELVEHYAAAHNTVFEEIELEGIGSFTPQARTFDTVRRFGTEPFCQANPECTFNAVLETDGTVSVTTYGNLAFQTRYGLNSNGRNIYLQPDGSLIPPNSSALLSEDGQSLTLSFLGWTLLAQPDAYTHLTVTGSVDVPALDAGKTYHASVLLFSPSNDGINILGRTFITDFNANNADFRLEYKGGDVPPADPYSVQISAAIFSGDKQADTPAALEFRTVFPGSALAFYDTNNDESVFESQLQTQIAVTDFSGMTSTAMAEATQESLPSDSQGVADLQFASIYGSYLHLIIGGQSACQVDGGRFQVYYPLSGQIPYSGLPSQWLAGNGAPCTSPAETQLSVDLRPLITERTEPGEPVPETLEMAAYGTYTPVLAVFPQRRVYTDSVGCFAQQTCTASLDFRVDGALHYQRGPFIGVATYGISLDGRTIFSEGIPFVSGANASVFLSDDGQSVTSAFVGELFRDL